MMSDDLVLLLPGFFGFTRISGLYYFAERVAAAIRGGLDMCLGQPVPVVPLTTLPAGSLHDRQESLVQQLRALLKRTGRKPRLHLIGHSTGGVDAYLLTCERQAAGAQWTAAQDEARRQLASITTVASPFRGTWLTANAVAKFALDPRHNAKGLVTALKLVHELLAWRFDKSLFADVISSATAGLPDAAKLCWNLLQHRQLIGELTPDYMEQLLQDNPRKLDVPFTSFVTAVPEGLLHHASPFFADLYEMTSGDDTAPVSTAITAATDLLNAHAADAMRPAGCEPPVFEPGVNDGIVNSARQVLDPADRSTLGGIIVADHLDVLGYYDGVDALVSGRPLNQSVFRSGAGFGDDQFFQLYGNIAGRIKETMSVSRSRPVLRSAS
jgi:pimeloyl-ACP methyl ester carboxylesterase